MDEHGHAHSDTDKLKVVLPHLLKHNREHIDDMAKWLDRARQSGLFDVAEDLQRVIEYSEKTNECLEAAISKLERTGHD